MQKVLGFLLVIGSLSSDKHKIMMAKFILFYKVI